MLVNNEEKQSLWFQDNALVFIDQRNLPFSLDLYTATTVKEVAFAIKEMVVRGAPAIGAAAAYGMVIGSKTPKETAKILQQTRPTAFDLFYATNHMLTEIQNGKDPLQSAHIYVEDIINRCKKIGEHGAPLIKNNMKILTHCNAGALATVDYGTALAPFRVAKKNNKKFFVYADETRPRLQGLLTAWELHHEHISHAVIADNAAGYFMRKKEIDLVIVGTDRVAKNGDFANKIGTYEKAVLAKENNIPFYVAAPISTFDTSIPSGDDIIIEEREAKELTHHQTCRLMPENTSVKNPAFDVTPHEYVTGFITEEGIKKI